MEDVKVAVVAADFQGDVKAQTPIGLPNVVLVAVQPIVAIAIRFANVYATTWVGLVVAAMTPEGGKLLYTTDFLHTALLCASLAFPGAAVAFVKDLITVFGKLEGKYPLLTGGV